VDHFHLIMLANQAVTTVRQRVTRELLGRRGRAVDPPGRTAGCCCAAGNADDLAHTNDPE